MVLPRQLVIGATTALLALTLTACSPPNERDSNLRVETATGVAAPTAATTSGGATTVVSADSDAPGFIDCVSAPEQLPTGIALSCVDDSDQLEEITWESWGRQSASGTATRVTISPSGEERRTEDISVELSVPTTSPQGLVFTQITIDDEVIYL